MKTFSYKYHLCEKCLYINKKSPETLIISGTEGVKWYCIHFLVYTLTLFLSFLNQQVIFIYKNNFK